MSQNQRVAVDIANTRLEVPVVLDAATSRLIADQVNERFAELEEQTGRIDTQRFALLTAFAFAAESYLAAQKGAEDERALLTALDSLHQTLEKTAARLDGPDEP